MAETSLSADERFAHLLALPDNWNSYGSPPISPACVERARPFFALLNELGMSPWITPTNNGGIMLERAGTDDYSVDFYPDGTTELYLADLTDAEVEKILRASAQAIETRRAGTERLGAQHESAVGTADAPVTPTPTQCARMPVDGNGDGL